MHDPITHAVLSSYICLPFQELPRAFEKQCDFVDDKQVVDAKGKKLITVVSVVLLLSVASGLGYQITKRLSSS